MTNKDIPAWAMEPFDTFIHDIERLTVHTIVASLGGAFIITDQELAMQRLSQMATISNNLITDDIQYLRQKIEAEADGFLKRNPLSIAQK